MSDNTQNILQELETSDYKYGFVSDIETETIGRGLSEDVVRLISQKKGEPEWMLERRLKAYRHWLTLKHPNWAHLDIPEIDFQDVIYYAAPKQKPKLGSMDEVDPELKRTFDKLGIPLRLSYRNPFSGHQFYRSVTVKSCHCMLFFHLTSRTDHNLDLVVSGQDDTSSINRMCTDWCDQEHMCSRFHNWSSCRQIISCGACRR